MALQIDVFLRQLLVSSQKNEVVNMTTRRQALRCRCRRTLGLRLRTQHTQIEDTNKIIPAAMKSTSYRIGLYMAWPTISFVDPVILWLGRKQIPKFYQALRKMIGRRMSMPKNSAHNLYAVASEDVTASGDKGLQDTAFEEAKATMRRAFVSFALGDRACAGKAMAYLETSLTIAKTLWYFDFEKASSTTGGVGGGTPRRTNGRDRMDEYRLYDIFTADHDGQIWC
ncbi:hypothetical protein F4804DRAFT_333361 [Jackrogersella minutella]|nr:hypothetical protein F4804DRAFT_333361 [Jackrogersella minutella]